MANKSISAAGESSMPAARGHRRDAGDPARIFVAIALQLPAHSHGASSPAQAGDRIVPVRGRAWVRAGCSGLRDRPSRNDSEERGRMAEAGRIDGPRWYAETTVAAPQRAPPVQDADVDVCVIGGGLAGLTVAREIVRAGWSVVVLEAEKIAWNASGRNAGFVAPGFSERIENIIERVGLSRAKQLWALSDAGAEYVRATIRETGMPGVTPVDGRLIVLRRNAEDELLRYVAMMRVDFGAQLDAWPTEQVREVLRSERYFQAVHLPSAFQIHPRNYALGLAAAAEQAGARIFEDTPALAMDSAGVRKRIDTPKGLGRAGHGGVAGGAHLGSVFRAVSETLLPVSSYMAVTAPLGEALGDAVRYRGSVSDTRRGGACYRVLCGDG